MNDEELNRLIAAARRAPPDTSSLEHGFETRLLARLRARAAAPPAALPWFGLAWRAVPVAAALVVALAAWTLGQPSAREAVDLPEATLGAADASMLVTHFTGD
jgi:hypothetical protein